MPFLVDKNRYVIMLNVKRNGLIVKQHLAVVSSWGPPWHGHLQPCQESRTAARTAIFSLMTSQVYMVMQPKKLWKIRSS